MLLPRVRDSLTGKSATGFEAQADSGEKLPVGAMFSGNQRGRHFLLAPPPDLSPGYSLLSLP